MKYDYAVYIGRFQLPHKAHFDTMEKALEEAGNLIIAIGSSNVRRSLRNPFSYAERMMLIEHGASEVVRKAINQGRVRFVPLEDSYYSDQWWVEHVQRQVNRIVYDHQTKKIHKELLSFETDIKKLKIGLIGCNRDETTYYLDMFPQWGSIQVEQTKIFSATDCRNAYFEFGIEDKRAVNKLYDFTTSGVINALRYIPSDVFSELSGRFQFVHNYKQRYGEGPHYTADAVVIKSGHVLLVTRGQEPDIGSLAFPGGFINKGEDSENAARRECQEETGLILPEHYCKAVGDYSMPFRDDRGDIRTTACLYDLGIGSLPEVKGADDALEAKWVPFVDLSASNMFSDHYHIMRDLLKRF